MNRNVLQIRVGFLVGILIALAAPVHAHHLTGNASQDGVIIPPVSHGQMRTLARNRDAIVDLADQQPVADPTFRRLQNFVAIQHTVCLWAIMPGSVSDETSPFNECAHAELAGARALLLHMAEMPNARHKATALIASIQREMLDDRTSFKLCRFGDKPFSTGDVVFPHLGQVLSHTPTALTLFSVVLLPLACGAAFAAKRAQRRSGYPI